MVDGSFEVSEIVVSGYFSAEGGDGGGNTVAAALGKPFPFGDDYKVG